MQSPTCTTTSSALSGSRSTNRASASYSPWTSPITYVQLGGSSLGGRESDCVKGIIIGAGRGRRLMPLTEETPKCFAEIGGRRLIDWAREAFAAAGIEELVF